MSDLPADGPVSDHDARSDGGDAPADGGDDPRTDGGDDVAAAVEAFLDEAETVLAEYDQGYMDADAALTRLRRGIEDLRAAAEE